MRINNCNQLCKHAKMTPRETIQIYTDDRCHPSSSGRPTPPPPDHVLHAKLHLLQFSQFTIGARSAREDESGLTVRSFSLSMESAASRAAGRRFRGSQETIFNLTAEVIRVFMNAGAHYPGNVWFFCSFSPSPTFVHHTALVMI